MNRERAARERFALIVGEGAVRAVAEITGLSMQVTVWRSMVNSWDLRTLFEISTLMLPIR